MANEQAKRTAARTGALPGAWQAATIATLAAVLAGYVVARPAAPDTAVSANTSRLAEVSEADRSDALATVDGPQAQLAQFRQSRDCHHRLAWVTLVRDPGQPAGQIRLKSGNYASPAFALSDAPVRVALPYPAPYETGHGTIAVLGASVDTTVALSPPWHVPANQAWHTRDVTWTPAPVDCPAPAQ